MARRRVGFFSRVRETVTGVSEDERKANILAGREARKIELGMLRRERIKQASIIGRERAKIEAQRRIKRIREQPRGFSLGGSGFGFPDSIDPIGAFGGVPARQKTPSMPAIVAPRPTRTRVIRRRRVVKRRTPARRRVRRKTRAVRQPQQQQAQQPERFDILGSTL